MKDTPASDPKAIKEQLQRILSSPEFKATARQKKFLQFVIVEFLEGRSSEIKAYTVATHVFGRGAKFDPRSDPIVSIEAKRIRRALERYYLVAGRQDRLRIDIPIGSYVPTFHFQAGKEPDCLPQTTEFINDETEGAWPSVLIRPFQNFSEGIGPNFIAEGITTELAIELSRYQDIRVLMKPPGEKVQIPEDPKARFSIDGHVRCGTYDLHLAVQLFDQKNRRQVWGDIYTCNLKSDDLIAFQREVAQIISAKIAQEQGYISQTLSLES
jgi:adenylate cyclase